MLMRRDQSLMLIVDIQEKLAPAILNAETAVANTTKLIHAAKHLSVPMLASEQYPKGLGRTIPTLRELLPPESLFDKTHFSCLGESGVAERLQQQQRRQIIICGMEAHVCVLQTALDIKAAGFTTIVVADAVSSRCAENYELGLARMRDVGVTIVSTEMVLFEWIGQAGTPEFRALLPLIK
jgi:nicotinamidase-related amidase